MTRRTFYVFGVPKNFYVPGEFPWISAWKHAFPVLLASKKCQPARHKQTSQPAWLVITLPSRHPEAEKGEQK